MSYENCSLGELYSKQSKYKELVVKREEYTRRLRRKREDGMTKTAYYKNKVDEECRRSMNLPPRDDTLPSRATDPTLDLHPGDY